MHVLIIFSNKAEGLDYVEYVETQQEKLVKKLQKPCQKPQKPKTSNCIKNDNAQYISEFFIGENVNTLVWHRFQRSDRPFVV